jgi:hypothetical protein
VTVGRMARQRGTAACTTGVPLDLRAGQTRWVGVPRRIAWPYVWPLWCYVPSAVMLPVGATGAAAVYMRNSPRDMADSDFPRLYKATVIVSGMAKGMHVTREAVESAAEQLASHPVPINIEHDPTNPPMGRMYGPELVEQEDGELALQATMEIRDSMPIVIRSMTDYNEIEASLAAVEPERGPIGLDIDASSYEEADLDALKGALAQAGDVEAQRNVVRFSVVPDAILYVALGSGAIATWWFARGFFTKLGEQAAESVGPDLAALYVAFKQRAREMVSRRKPADQPPITIMTGRGGGARRVLRRWPRPAEGRARVSQGHPGAREAGAFAFRSTGPCLAASVRLGRPGLSRARRGHAG